MSDRSALDFPITKTVDPWILWIVFFSSILVFASLWIIQLPEWHIAISLATFTVLLIWSDRPIRILTGIIVLVAFLALLQIVFSPFMRSMFLKSLDEGFQWSDWKYLLFAVERFAWPLAIVTSFKTHLSSPKIISQLTFLLVPFKWLGLNIDKLQLLLLLALRFMPSLSQEWDRFTHLQSYFLNSIPQKSIIQRFKFWVGVFRAMLSHVIHRAVNTGDLLALRGLPVNRKLKTEHNSILPVTLWLGVGLVFILINPTVFYIWIGLSVWLGLVALGVDWELNA